MREAHPDVSIVTAAIDRELDETGYIRPGLGDAGDRIFGTDRWYAAAEASPPAALQDASVYASRRRLPCAAMRRHLLALPARGPRARLRGVRRRRPVRRDGRHPHPDRSSRPRLPRKPRRKLPPRRAPPARRVRRLRRQGHGQASARSRDRHVRRRRRRPRSSSRTSRRATAPRPRPATPSRSSTRRAAQDGTPFDNSFDRGEPFAFPLGGGQVIPGWDQGVAGMKEGGRRVLRHPVRPRLRRRRLAADDPRRRDARLRRRPREGHTRRRWRPRPTARTEAMSVDSRRPCRVSLSTSP